MTTMRICGQPVTARIIAKHRHHERVIAYVGVVTEGNFTGDYVTWLEIDGKQHGGSSGPAMFKDWNKWERDCEEDTVNWNERWLQEHDEREAAAAIARASAPGIEGASRLPPSADGGVPSILGSGVGGGR